MTVENVLLIRPRYTAARQRLALSSLPDKVPPGINGRPYPGRNGLFLSSAGFGHLAMLARQNTGRRYIGRGGLSLVLEPANDIALTFYHGTKSVVGDHGGVVLFGRSNVGVPHLRTPEEFRLGGAGHEAGDRHLGVLEFLPQR